MMAMGMRRALPSDESSTRPSARGPLVSLFFLATCVDAIWATPRTTVAQVTARRALRYKHERIGEPTMLEVNDKAPDIKLVDENGQEVSLKDFKGKTVVL